MHAFGRSGQIITDRIVSAHLLHKTFGGTLLRDPRLKDLLCSLDRNIGATQREMVSTGIVKECADCAVNGDGTCCGTRTGHKCDGVLLLINLLLGRSLPLKPHYSDLCYFLTGEGCALRARHIICVNFVCQRLRQKILHSELVRLQQIAGSEMDMLFTVEEYIKKKLGAQTLNQYRPVL